MLPSTRLIWIDLFPHKKAFSLLERVGLESSKLLLREELADCNFHVNYMLTSL